MKIVIDIPEEHYNDMKNTPVWWSGLKECVLNGKPLDDVLDKIRSEIEEQKKERCFDDMFEYITGLDDALYIIGKYKAESEVRDADSD